MEFSFTLKVNVAKEKIWPYYADTQKWFVWEEDLEDITLEGDFAQGAKGVMKLAGMPPLPYTLTRVVENQEFWDATETLFGTVIFGHEILEKEGGVFVRHTVRLEGAEFSAEKLAFLKQVFSDVPDAIVLLKAAVEQ